MTNFFKKASIAFALFSIASLGHAQDSENAWFISPPHGGCYAPKKTPLANIFPGLSKFDSISPEEMKKELSQHAEVKQNNTSEGLIFFSGKMNKIKNSRGEDINFVFALIRKDWCIKNKFKID